ncbi:zn-dependent hydrolases of the beta-lactamase [Botrytis cinerea]
MEPGTSLLVLVFLATPCKHWPGHECVGFVVHTESFGISVDGKPNAIYFSGDTVYIEELAKIADKYHIAVAILNCGEATFENFDAKGQPSQTGSSIQITMGGQQAAHLFRDIKADVLVPMHYDAWDHFKQKEEGLSAEFREEGIMSRVCWLQPGKAVLIDPST